MEALSTIATFSAVVWYIIDRIKPFWAKLSWGKWITIAISAILCGAGTALFNLNIIAAFGFETSLPIVAQYAITTVILMSGSSCVNEILDKAQYLFNRRLSIYRDLAGRRGLIFMLKSIKI